MVETLNKVRVLLLEPTGVAAIKIDGTTIYFWSKYSRSGKNVSLNDKNRALLRKKYSELIINNKISMVPSKLPFQVHQRLTKTFESPSSIPFGAKSVTLCGDLYPLPTVRAKAVFMFDEYSPLLQVVVSVDLWRNFKAAELTKVMRQKDDADFTHLLNRIRV